MNQIPQKLQEALQELGAERVLRDRAALAALLRAPDTQKILALLQEQSGGQLLSYAEAAAAGRPERLRELLQAAAQNSETGRSAAAWRATPGQFPAEKTK
jgi:hypothetical protein